GLISTSLNHLAHETQISIIESINERNHGDPPTLEDLKKNPPNHPDYKAPRSGPKLVRNPNGTGKGWLDRNGRVWVPTDHKGTHAPHWDVQKPGGTHQNIYPEFNITLPSPSLRDQIGMAVGLTGTALTVYIIISEGSRFLFPPRNLIPIP